MQTQKVSFDTVKHLKETRHPNPEDEVQEIAQLCAQFNLDLETVLRILIRSCRQRCTNNFIDDADYGFCTDDEGQNVAFGLDEIAEAYNLDRKHLRCKEVNEHGCCARINQIVYSLIAGIYEYAEEQHGKDTEVSRGTETEG